MIQQQPFCFGCESKVDRLEEAVFAPPWCDHDDCCSAVFHGLCLMQWRERREELRLQIQRRMEAFRRHVEGECDCDG